MACSASTSPWARPQPTHPAQFQVIEDQLNDRLRKRLGYRTSREELDRLLAENQPLRRPLNPL
jgi:hypothetical protein